MREEVKLLGVREEVSLWEEVVLEEVIFEGVRERFLGQE